MLGSLRKVGAFAGEIQEPNTTAARSSFSVWHWFPKSLASDVLYTSRLLLMRNACRHAPAKPYKICFLSAFVRLYVDHENQSNVRLR